MSALSERATLIAETSVVLLACVLSNGAASAGRGPGNAFASYPPLTIWAWERPEQLTRIDPARVAVAFLAETVYLREEPAIRPRMQPLRVPANTKLTAVVRIEARPGSSIDSSPEYRQRLTAAILHATKLPGLTALQIDFDATLSQREFYAGVIRELRKQMPPGMPLSITALASWCVGDQWLSGLPIDEAVPMMFRMGAPDRLAIVHALGNGGMREPLCTSSIGLSTDEPWPDVLPGLHVYVFHPRPWDTATLASLQRRLNR